MIRSPKAYDGVHGQGLTAFMIPIESLSSDRCLNGMLDEPLFIKSSRAGTDAIELWIARQHSLMFR